VDPSFILSPLVSFTEAAPGSGRQPIPAGEVSLLAVGVFRGFWLGLSNPRYLYAMPHWVGCRLIASLLVGARPRGEVERLLFERAVVGTGERSRQRVVLLERLPHPDFIRQKGLRDPWALASLRFWTEVELPRMAALAVAAAWPKKCIPYPPWSPRPSIFLLYDRSDEGVLEEWLRDSMEFEEVAERCGIPFARPEPLPLPVDGEAARRAHLAVLAAGQATGGAGLRADAGGRAAVPGQRLRGLREHRPRGHGNRVAHAFPLSLRCGRRVVRGGPLFSCCF
jgi:hypothetical protein